MFWDFPYFSNTTIDNYNCNSELYQLKQYAPQGYTRQTEQCRKNNQLCTEFRLHTFQPGIIPLRHCTACDT